MTTLRATLRIGALGATVASLLIWVAGSPPLVSPAGGAVAAVAAGSATAAGVLVGYSDKETFYPGSPTEPPNTYAPYATGGFDNTGTGSASAALVYNPYQDFAGAINGLAPAGAPEVPAGALGARSRASVRGAPPQTYDASVLPGQGPTVGTMRAALDEQGPEARAEAVAVTAEPLPGLTVTSATTRTTMTRADGRAHSVATSVLDGVSVNQVLTFRRIALDATSTADGGDGAGQANVRVVGAAVNGTAVELTEAGLVLAGTAAPVSAGPLAEALREAGIEVVAPGRRTVAAGGDATVTTAQGPSLVVTGQDGQRIEVTLGSASALALLFNPAADSVAPPATPAGNEQSEPATPSGADPSAGATATSGTPAQPVAAASPYGALPVRSAFDDASTGGAGGIFVRRGASDRSDTAAAGHGLVDGVLLQAEPARATTAPASPLRRLVAAPASSEAGQLAGAEATERTTVVYGVLAGVAIALVVASLCVPRGDLWSAKEG